MSVIKMPKIPKIPKIPTLIRNDAQKPLKTHSCPIDVLVLFYASLIPQSGDFSGATLGVRSVALLQVPKLLAYLRSIFG